MLTKIITKMGFFWILFALTPIFLGLVFAYRYSPVIEFQILSLAAFCYLITAIFHHIKDKTLRVEVMIEYILIAVLALIVLQSWLF